MVLNETHRPCTSRALWRSLTLSYPHSRFNKVGFALFCWRVTPTHPKVDRAQSNVAVQQKWP